MQSKRKTTVAVLRQTLELSVEEFAKLIGKSVTTINSLESGRLKLSEETAFVISRETGIGRSWLLKNKPKEKPRVFDVAEGVDRPFTKAVFQARQAQKKYEASIRLNPDLLLIDAIQRVTHWVAIYTAAAQKGQGALAYYLMSEFLEKLDRRLGKDVAAVVELNPYARIVANDGSEWVFRSYGDFLVLQGPLEAPKS